MIILDNVSKHYQTRDKTRFAAVEPTSLEIQDGEIFGLMGYSGAGKSTLLRLINLLERPDSGKVNVCGQELTALDAAALRQARQNIGMVFQQFNLLSNRTVADNVAFPLEIAGWSSEKIKERVKECLEIVGLTERADHYPAQLSGGQKQRVGIAQPPSPPRRRTHFRPRPRYHAQRLGMFGRHQQTLQRYHRHRNPRNERHPPPVRPRRPLG